MKRLLIATALTTMTTALSAAPIYHPTGPNLVYGDVSNGRTVLSATNNPAAPADKLINIEEKWSLGIFPSYGVGAEFGEVDNLFDEIDDTRNTINDTQEQFSDVQSTENAITSTVDQTNKIIQLVEDGGYGKAFTTLNLPVTPLDISSETLGGTLSFDANVSALGKISALGENINIDINALTNFLNDVDTVRNDILNNNTPDQTIVNRITSEQSFGDINVNYDIPNNSVNMTFENDSVALLKASAIGEFGLGYSRKVYDTNSGKLYGGVKGKYYRVELVRDIEKISELEEGSEDYFENFDYDNASKSNGFGVDLGVLWAADFYRVGATITNLNEPSFEYNTPDLVNQIRNDRIRNAILEDTTYTMERQLKLEGALQFLNSKNLVLGASLDANAIKDPVGDEYQWANASIAYITDTWFIPGGRIGYRKNLAGSELSYIQAGFTFLFVNFDAAMSLEDVEVDGDTYPRSLYFNLGVEYAF